MGVRNQMASFLRSLFASKKAARRKGFDEGHISDWDVAITSKALLERAKNAGIPLRAKGKRTRPLVPKDLEKLGLRDTVERLSTEHGRPISLMIFETEEAVKAEGPYLPIPR